jgi:hypothetical protein
MYYTVFNSEGEAVETSVFDFTALASLVSYYGEGAYAEDSVGNRVDLEGGQE